MASPVGQFVTVDAAAMRRIVMRTGAAQQVVAKPLGSTRGQEAARILRFGARGVKAQFADQTEYRGKASMPWKKGHDFGIRKAPAKTMHGTGAYRAAWLGGANSFVIISSNSVRIGVKESAFPQVKVHQGRYAVRVIKPKTTMRAHTTSRKKGKNGSVSVVTKSTTDYNMRWKLGLTYGVWFSKKRLKKGLRLHRRRLSVASATKKEISTFLARDVKVALQGKRR